MTQDLIKRCTKQNRRAQRELYNAYAPKVMGICRRYANDPEDAHDIFQEAFINVFNSFKKTKSTEIKSLEAWIRRITANTAINYYYKIKKHIDHVSTEGIPPTNSGEEYEHILSMLGVQELLALIEKLPVGCKMVFNLYAIEGYSHKEIAEMMGISEGTSKSQLSRAKDIIKSKLKILGYVNCKNAIS